MRQRIKEPLAWRLRLDLIVACRCSPRAATAAKLITGKDIKDHSITGKDIKKGSSPLRC